MKKYLNLFTALIASLKPKSELPIISNYGQSTFTQEQQQDLMEWLFASLMGAGYFSKAHLAKLTSSGAMIGTGDERCLPLCHAHSRFDDLFGLAICTNPVKLQPNKPLLQIQDSCF